MPASAGRAHRREQRAHALGDPEPEEQAEHRREEADDQASSATEPITWRREAPSVRSVANSAALGDRDRERVGITNAPTNSAMPPKPSRKYVMNFRLSLVSLGRRPPAPRTSSPARLRGAAGRSGRPAPRPSRRSWRRRGSSRTCRVLEQLLRGREVEDRDRGAADRVFRSEADDAADRVLRQRPVAERTDGLTDSKSCAVAVDLSIAISRSPWGECPLTSWIGLRLLIGSCVDADREALAVVADWLAVRVDEPRLVLDRALRETHAGQGLTSLNTSAEKAGASLLPSLVLIACFEVMTASVALYESV